jgi:hypothetical protein
MMTTEMSAGMRPYSIAVAADFACNVGQFAKSGGRPTLNIGDMPSRLRDDTHRRDRHPHIHDVPLPGRGGQAR